MFAPTNQRSRFAGYAACMVIVGFLLLGGRIDLISAALFRPRDRVPQRTFTEFLLFYFILFLSASFRLAGAGSTFAVSVARLPSFFWGFFFVVPVLRLGVSCFAAVSHLHHPFNDFDRFNNAPFVQSASRSLRVDLGRRLDWGWGLICILTSSGPP